MASPIIIKCGAYADARGALRFCNGFDMTPVKRFYTILNSPEEPVRGWIGHKKETKWLFPIKGTTLICVESFNVESQNGSSVEKFVLDATAPQVLQVPPGNWFCIEQHDGAEVMVFSDCNVGEYAKDDLRRPL
jgi:dTDP-4-dehydrorhamnose 3,5-epimerase